MDTALEGGMRQLRSPLSSAIVGTRSAELKGEPLIAHEANPTQYFLSINSIYEVKSLRASGRVVLLEVRAWKTTTAVSPGVYKATTKALPDENAAWDYVFVMEQVRWVRGIPFTSDQSSYDHADAILDTRLFSTTSHFYSHQKIVATDQFY